MACQSSGQTHSIPSTAVSLTKLAQTNVSYSPLKMISFGKVLIVQTVFIGPCVLSVIAKVVLHLEIVVNCSRSMQSKIEHMILKTMSRFYVLGKCEKNGRL